MKKLLVVLFGITLLYGCANKEDNPSMLSFQKSYRLEIREPSGLALEPDGTALWTVSDNGVVYQINTSGEILKTFNIDNSDPEGITIVDDSTLCIVLENQRELLFISKKGEFLSLHKTGIKGDTNNGFEGISYDPENKLYYVLNEKNPGQLIVFDSSMTVKSRKDLDFAADYSGICYSEEGNELWIISHENKMIARCSLKGKIKESVRVNISKIEGIAVDNINKKIYIVSDTDEMLFIYNMEE